MIEMFIVAIIIIGGYSLSDFMKWMEYNGATDKDKFIVLCVIILIIFIIYILFAVFCT